MKHYIAYHNEAKMGAPLAEDNPFIAVSKRPLDYTVGHIVWFITRGPARGADYRLGSVFIGGETARINDDSEFTHAVQAVPGTGKLFDPPLTLTGLPWFSEFLNEMGRFGLGVHQTTNPDAIAAFLGFAAGAGWKEPQM